MPGGSFEAPAQVIGMLAVVGAGVLVDARLQGGAVRESHVEQARVQHTAVQAQLAAGVRGKGDQQRGSAPNRIQSCFHDRDYTAEHARRNSARNDASKRPLPATP